MDSRPVGMFDSGVGGLGVLRAFRKLAPAERVLYFADTAYFPYGPRPAAEVRKRAFAVVNRLLQSDVKIVVVACNTASAAAINDLREAFPVPFVGMVPGLKPAVEQSAARHVAILATPGTLDGELYGRVSAEFGRGTRVDNVPGEGLAEAVERGAASAPETAELVRELLRPSVGSGADTVVLGCTHYHFLKPVIERAFPDVRVIDTNEAVARRALQVLEQERRTAPEGADGGIDLIVSGDRDQFRAAMAGLDLDLDKGAP